VQAGSAVVRSNAHEIASNSVLTRAAAGQIELVPVQASSKRHGSFAVRQLTPAATSASAGQAGPRPVHDSATSQGPVDARQTTDASRNPSGGHAPLVPSHVSGASHGPAGARHTRPTGDGTQPVRGSHAPVRHAPLHARGPAPTHAPVVAQWSPTVHALPSSQGVVVGFATHPCNGSHVPVRHWPSQTSGAPGTQTFPVPLQ
jgi:hypothetical protein